MMSNQLDLLQLSDVQVRFDGFKPIGKPLREVPRSLVVVSRHHERRRQEDAKQPNQQLSPCETDDMIFSEGTPI